MLIVQSHNGVPIRLTEERWRHVVARHPEMGTLREEVLETIVHPELIQGGDSGDILAVRFWPKTPLTGKFLVVAYRELGNEDGFVLTAYLTNRPSDKRKILWKR